MPSLPLANLLHHKLRSVLSALGVGIGVCMLVTLSGWARGTLYEVADRWESVDADLIVFPHGWGNNAPTKSGSGLSDAAAPLIRKEHGGIVEQVTCVFTWHVRFGKLDQTVVGISPGGWDTVSGGRKLIAGRLPDPDGAFARWLEKEISAKRDDAFKPTEQDLAGGLEIVVDERLARAEKFELGQTIFAENHHWKIVGIAPTGVMARVFMPRRTTQFLFGDGNIHKSTLMFVKLRPPTDVGPAARAISATTGHDAIPLAAYRGMLIEKFGILFVYVDVVNIVAMIIAFLFTMTILYTNVIQQTREIAILKSFGASWGQIVGMVVGESALLTAGGVILGGLLSIPAKLIIETFLPLYTVTITWQWLLIAVGAAAAGAAVSAIYPAYRATKVDMVEALMFE